LLLTLLSFLAHPSIGACPVFPVNNIWNTPIDHLPVHPLSATYVANIGQSAHVHADFGSGLWDGGPIGIPFVMVPGSQTKYPATFYYASESDPGPYAVPLDAPIEGGPNSTGDRHALSVDVDNCILYELYRAFPQSSRWSADSGAIYNLLSHELRTLTWTSADAAGLLIFSGLVRYDEVASGEIRHAIRFTAPRTQRALYGRRATSLPPHRPQVSAHGQRFRLKADFDISSIRPKYR
jgi:hypothetical protein